MFVVGFLNLFFKISTHIIRKNLSNYYNYFKMKKFFIFMLLFCISIGLTGCAEKPAKIKYIGTGIIQCKDNTCFVEVDGTKYMPNYAYSGTLTDWGSYQTTSIKEGMTLTVFTINQNDQIEFMVGDMSKEFLEIFFAQRNYYFPVILLLIFGLVSVMTVIPSKHPKKVHPDTN